MKRIKYERNDNMKRFSSVILIAFMTLSIFTPKLSAQTPLSADKTQQTAVTAQPNTSAPAPKVNKEQKTPTSVVSADVKTEDDELLIHSLTCYRPYDLPAYEEIIAGQKSFFMN